MEIYQPSSEATSVGGSSLKPIWGLLILFVLVGTVYYGFQVRFILYFSGSVEFGGAAMTDDAALALYETFTIALYIAAGFGGLASDLLGKRKMVAMAGLVIMAAGLAFIPALGQQPGTAVVMTAVGYGLFQITLLIMLIEHFTGKAYKLDGLMVFYYFLFAFNSTFGALLGAAVFQGGSQSLGFYWLSRTYRTGIVLAVVCSQGRQTHCCSTNPVACKQSMASRQTGVAVLFGRSVGRIAA